MVQEDRKEEGLPEVQETPTPTAEEQLKTLQSQVQALTTEKERLEGGYKGLQKTLSERDRDLRKQTDLESRIAGIQDTMELLAGAIQARGEIEETDFETRETKVKKGQDILGEMKKRRDADDAKRKQEENLRISQEYNQKADALYTRAKAVFGEGDETLERVEDLLIAGRLERAETRVSKAESAKGVKGNKTMETEEQRIERRASERLQAELEKRGLLEEFTSAPSGKMTSIAEATKLYKDGEITVEEARKRGVIFS